MSLRCLPSSFGSIRLKVWEEMSFKEFPDGTILTILNLYVALMPPIKFRLNQCLGGDVVWRISRWPPWQPSWISEWNDFSKSESLCRTDASHQVSAQSDLWFWRRCRLSNFKMPPWRPSWISERNDFSNSESLCHCDASHQVLAQSELRFGKTCRLKNFKLISEGNFFSNFESRCCHNASH